MHLVQLLLMVYTRFPWFVMLAAANLVDLFTGILKAIVWKKLDSKITHRGVTRKVAVWALIGFLGVIDNQTPGIHEPALAASFYTAWELASILENLNEMGVPIPKPLIDALTTWREKIGAVTASRSEVASLRQRIDSLEENKNDKDQSVS